MNLHVFYEAYCVAAGDHCSLSSEPSMRMLGVLTCPATPTTLQDLTQVIVLFLCKGFDSEGNNELLIENKSFNTFIHSSVL